MIKEVKQLGGTSIEFYINKTIPEMYPKRNRLKTVGMSKFSFSEGEPLESPVASTCTLAVLEGQDDNWGLYHGYFHKKDDMRKYSGHTPLEIANTKTLEDFLNAWNDSGNRPAVAAYLFAAGSVDNTNENEEYRKKAIAIVREKTGLPDDRIFIRWNDYEEGEMVIILDPESHTIKINMDFGSNYHAILDIENPRNLLGAAGESRTLTPF